MLDAMWPTTRSMPHLCTWRYLREYLVSQYVVEGARCIVGWEMEKDQGGEKRHAYGGTCSISATEALTKFDPSSRFLLLQQSRIKITMAEHPSFTLAGLCKLLLDYVVQS
jgi:hypothetical protein